MANEADDGVPPPAINPPDTRILDTRIEAHLKAMFGGGGGPGRGGPDGTEARIAKLEADVSNISDNVKDVRENLRGIHASVSDIQQRLSTSEANIKHLPSKGFIVTTVLTSLAVLAALILFQHQIQQMFGVTTSGPR